MLPNLVNETPRHIWHQGVGQQLGQADKGLEEDNKQESEEVDVPEGRAEAISVLRIRGEVVANVVAGVV